MSVKGTRTNFRLGAVDEVPQDPPTAIEALAIATFPAETAMTTRRDARNKNAVARSDTLDPVADLDDRSDCLMTQDAPRSDLGDVARQDVQVRPTDGRGIDLDDGVGVALDRWVGYVLPCLRAGSLVDERLHRVVLPV